MRSTSTTVIILFVMAFEGDASTDTLVRISHHGAALDIRRLPDMMAKAVEAPGARLPSLTRDDREAERCFLQDGMVLDLLKVEVQIIDSKCPASYSGILSYLTKAEKVLGIRFDCEPDYDIIPEPAIRRVSNSPTPKRHQTTTKAPRADGNPRIGTNDPISSRQSNLERIRIGEAWKLVKSAKGNSKKAILAIFDTGVDPTHPDLVNQFWRDPTDGSVGYNSFEDNRNVTDYDGHGTLVAGVAGAQTNNSIGIAGVADVELMIVKSTQGGRSSGGAILKGLDFAVRMGAAASVHSYTTSHSVIHMIAFSVAAASGHVIVVAAGNAGENLDKRPQYPCSYAQYIPCILCVAGSTSSRTPGAIASWSNIGSVVKIAAPGVGIHTTTLNGLYSVAGGTSVSTPQVAAVAAMLASLGLVGQEIIDAIIKSRTTGLSNKFNMTDVGELDAMRAVEIALDHPTGTPTTTTLSSKNDR